MCNKDYNFDSSTVCLTTNVDNECISAHSTNCTNLLTLDCILATHRKYPTKCYRTTFEEIKIRLTQSILKKQTNSNGDHCELLTGHTSTHTEWHGWCFLLWAAWHILLNHIDSDSSNNFNEGFSYLFIQCWSYSYCSQNYINCILI